MGGCWRAGCGGRRRRCGLFYDAQDDQPTSEVGDVGVVPDDVNAKCQSRRAEGADLGGVGLVGNRDHPKPRTMIGDIGVVPDDVNVLCIAAIPDMCSRA